MFLSIKFVLEIDSGGSKQERSPTKNRFKLRYFANAKTKKKGNNIKKIKCKCISKPEMTLGGC